MMAVARAWGTIQKGASAHAVVPVHLNGDALPATAYDTNSFAFSRFTTANLSNARDEAGNMQHIFWLHLVLAFAFVGYALFLIHLHYEVRRAAWLSLCVSTWSVLPASVARLLSSGAARASVV